MSSTPGPAGYGPGGSRPPTSGTVTGPLKRWGGDEIPPTNKSFEVDFLTVALWDDGRIVEENLLYDLVIFMQQLGLSG
jgi:SnoaL-like polyketide cyclase